jgi:hypothetical protein
MSRYTRAKLLAPHLLVAAAAVALLLVATPAVAAPPQVACDKRTNNTYQKLLECVRVEGVRAHQSGFPGDRRRQRRHARR